MTQKEIFRSAFTPDGWIDAPWDHESQTLLFSADAAATARTLHNMAAQHVPDERFIDPMMPDRIEGFRCKKHAVLLSDAFHRRFPMDMPFFTDTVEYAAGNPHLSEEKKNYGKHLLTEQQQLLQNAERHMKAARSLLGETLKNASRFLCTEEILKTAQNIADHSLPSGESDSCTDTICTRFFTGWTAVGRIFCENALYHNVKQSIVVSDAFGAASRLLMLQLLRIIRSRKVSVCIGRCPVFYPDKIDHLLLPECGILITVSNLFHPHRYADAMIDCETQLMHQGVQNINEKARLYQTCASQQMEKAQHCLKQFYICQTALDALLTTE